MAITLNNQTEVNLDIPFSDVVQNSLTVNRFSATGSTIEIGSATAAEVQVTLDNSVAKARQVDYDDIVFEGARVSFAFKHIEVENDTDIVYTLYFAIATVDEVTRQGDYIHLVLLDDMVKLDKPVSGTIPTSVASMISAICTAGGFVYASAESEDNLLNDDITLAAPTSENLTYRQLLQWVCQITGTCAYIGVINGTSKLVLDWYGGANGEADDSAVNKITPSNRFSSTIDQQPIEITGVSVKVGDTAYESKSSAAYVLSIEGNELISESTAQTIATGLASRLSGFSYTPFTADTNGLVWLQPLDMVVFTDKDGNDHDVIITDWTFSPYMNVKLSGKGESQTRRGYATNAPFTAEQTRIIEEIKRNQPEVNVDDRLIAALSLNEAINNGVMLHSTTVNNKLYYHDAATLAASTYIVTSTSNGVGWTTNGWNDGDPVWDYGITADGNALLNQLAAYSINADLITAGKIDASVVDVENLNASNITTGILADAANKNTINFENGNLSLGNGNIVYNAETNTFSINSSVVIGAAQEAVADVLGGAETEYAISESGTTPPSDGGSETNTFYFADYEDITADITGTINEWYGNPSDWADGAQYFGSCVSLTPSWDSNHQYLYAFDRTDYSDGTYTITNGRLVATHGGSSSTTIATDTLYFLFPLDSIGAASIYDNWDSDFKALSKLYITNLSWGSPYNYLYSFTRTVKGNGSATISDVVTYTYDSGSQSEVLETQKWWIALGSNATDSSFETALNNGWHSTYKNYRAIHYFETPWDIANIYLKTVVRTVYADGSSTVTNAKNEAEYGTSYPQFGGNTWSTTMPSIAENKGKYLWTRTSYDGETWSYSVNYIGADGQQGQDGQDGQDGSDGADGKGIASITTYYTATTGTTLPQNPNWVTSPSATLLNASNPYLWSYTHTTYTDNSTPTDTTPVIIGHYGKDGSGGEGTQGRGIQSITTEYTLTTSNSTQPSSSAVWTTTIPEYPSVGTLTAVGVTQETSAQPLILSNINLVSGKTYTISYHYEAAAGVSTSLYLNTSGGTRLKTINVGTSSTSGYDTFTASSDYSGCLLWFNNASKEITYNVTVEGSGLSARYYYWQRDRIVWDDNSADTVTDAIPCTGFNTAIYETNRLNPAFAETYLEGTKQVYIDAGHIYANSMTAYQAAFTEAFIKQLMANYVRVDGNIDVINGDITITSIDPPEELSIDYLNRAMHELYPEYTGTYENIDSVRKSIINLRARFYQNEALSKFVVENNSYASFVFPKGLRVYDKTGNKEPSRYERDLFTAENGRVLGDFAVGFLGTTNSSLSVDGNAIIGGDLTVSGTINGGGSSQSFEKGFVSVTINSSNTQGTEDVSFNETYSTPPTVLISPRSSSTSQLNAFEVALYTDPTTTGFSVAYYSRNSYNPDAGFWWVAIP